MKPITTTVLTINGGSSGIKFALYDTSDSLKLLFSGELEFGGKKTKLILTDALTLQQVITDIKYFHQDDAANFLINQIEKQDYFGTIKVIGHRIVHGMKHTDHELITPELLKDLKNIMAYDPEH